MAARFHEQNEIGAGVSHLAPRVSPTIQYVHGYSDPDLTDLPVELAK